MRGLVSLWLLVAVADGSGTVARPALAQEHPQERLQVLRSAASGLRSPCEAAGTSDRLAGLTPHGEIMLASGALAHLSQVRLPDGSAERESALAWLHRRIGREVLVQAVADRDRWGRIPARLVLTEDPERLDLARGLVEAGLALVDPGAMGVLCEPELLDLEASARKQGLGLWAQARYNPVPVEHVERLRERIGGFVLVEGRIRSVGERRQWTYLNFGTDWANDFTIILSKKAWIRMTERGLTALMLRGRRIRARGILEDRQGPALTIALPEMIESLGEEPKRR
jgi:hypothetical protein